jgi:ABC-type glycerol-3-phosphate transport system substrate-binding protein
MQAGKETQMAILTRRSVLRGTLGIAASGTLARPHLANAAATTATVWWTQGFAEEEDGSFKKIVADYEKASGNTIDYSIVPYAPMRQKIVSAVTSGGVPDLFQNTPAEIIALYAWQDKLVPSSQTAAARLQAPGGRTRRWLTPPGARAPAPGDRAPPRLSPPPPPSLACPLPALGP